MTNNESLAEIHCYLASTKTILAQVEHLKDTDNINAKKKQHFDVEKHQLVVPIPSDFSIFFNTVILYLGTVPTTSPRYGFYDVRQCFRDCR